MTVTPPRRDAEHATGFLTRLLHDAAGSTLALVAAAIMPLLALIGGGIDISRGYLSESRLQQACDAGVLAARKRLGSEVVTTGVVPDDVAQTGQRFFDVNFADGAYGTTDRSFTMRLESDYSITGTAAVTVPTTIMRLFGDTSVHASVTCQARLNFSNTDVMMVLDTTGSMGDVLPGDSVTKIAALRQVVKSFYNQLEASKAAGTRVRYGFVPYSVNVNVGGLLKSDWLVDNWSYQGRQATAPGDPSSQWTYAPMTYDLSLVKGASGNDPPRLATMSVQMGGTPVTPTPLSATFVGCIEERATYDIDDYDNVDFTRALDLDLDTVPTPGNPATQWRPMFHQISYLRSLTWSGGSLTPDPVTTGQDFVNANEAGHSVCPAPARKLDTISSGDLDTYLNALTPAGNTYHDIGMIWGGRLLSPTGLFADENADQPDRPTSRNLIFLTDGETAPLDISYGAYGIEPLDKRRWSPGSPETLTQVVESRFTVACKEVKKRNITVWVVGFGTEMTDMLKDCAGDGHWFQANDAGELTSVFSSIAKAMGDLRIGK